MSARLNTIGHSNHSFARFLELIQRAGVTLLADVRSRPVSRWVPHFNRQSLEATLPEHGIAYLFLGRELGGRPDDPSLLKHGRPDYNAMARTPEFEQALARMIDASSSEVVALMCAERDPLDCHRFLLIGRALAAQHVDVAHILAGGEIEPHADTERRAGARYPEDLFRR